MLPHLADRPLTMIRMPDGIGGQRFFQKHWEQARPEFVETITVFSGTRTSSHEYLLCNNLPTLLWLAQSGHARVPRLAFAREARRPTRRSKSTDYASSLEALEASVLNYPDYVLFDIDPYIYSGKEAKGAEPELNTVAFEKGKEVAFWLRELLQSMSLEPIVKTSGKTGLHVFVPIERTIDFDAARQVSELVGRHLMRLHPKDITHGVEHAQAHRQDLHGLQHERPRQDAERRVFAARRARRAGVDAADVGRAGKRPSARLPPHQRGAAPGRNGRSLARRADAQAEPRARSRAR